MVKFTIWLPDEKAAKVDQIHADEHRQSKSNTIAALVGEALAAREVPRAPRPGARG